MATAVFGAERRAGVPLTPSLRPPLEGWLRRATGARTDLRLLGYAAQVVVSHCMSAILEEMVFFRRGFSHLGIYGATEFAVFAAMPLLECHAKGGWRAVKHLLLVPKGDWLRFVYCGVLMTLSHGAGLWANLHINYSAATLFSAARLPMVLLVGAVVHQNGRVTPLAHLFAMETMLGICIFSFAERRDSPRFSVQGLLLVAVNLLLGSFTFNYQQKVLQGRSLGSSEARSGAQLMVVQYVTSAFLCAFYALATGEGTKFSDGCREHNRTRLGELSPVVVAAALTSVGVRALLRVTAEFDAARSSVITSSRKVCTFVLSFIIFRKPVSVLHVIGAGVTLAGSVGVHWALGPPAHKAGSSAVGAGRLREGPACGMRV